MTPMTNNLRLPVFSQLGGSPPTPGSSPTLDAGLDPAEGSGEGPIEAEHGLMQIGDLARECGKTVRAIHLYEELDLLKPAARSKGRYRLYGSDALVRIRWIGKLQEMGFSLSDIQQIVRDWEGGGKAPNAMRKMREVYAKKLEETRDRLRLRQPRWQVIASWIA